MKRSSVFFLAVLCALLSSGRLGAKVLLPRLFSDGMVVQRGRTVPVWGWADAGETVRVSLGRKSLSTVASADGRWRVDLPAMKAGGPYELRVTSRAQGAQATADATSEVVVPSVYVGDVWLCSGQSNIDTDVERVYPQYPDEINRDANDRIRLFRVDNVPQTHGPKDDVSSAAGWQSLSRDNAWHFSALGYFLGKRMYQATGVPQGIIQSSWGGTPIEAWLPSDSMMARNPRAARQTMLYDDPRLVEAIDQANRQSNNTWQQLIDRLDPGMATADGQPPLWTRPDFDDSRWPVANQYRLPLTERQFCGSYWLRQHVTIDAAHAGRPALLQLGTLYDADYTYVNGREVGRTYYQYPPRRYSVPAGLLREGDNVIAVRIVNKQGRPSFWAGKPYRLEFSGPGMLLAGGTPTDETDFQPLSEQWRVSDGVQMPTQPSAPMTVHYLASTLWNGMLTGLAPYAVSGVVWYQGESNTGRAVEYQSLLGCLMSSWRQLFQQPHMPFAIVQLAGFMAPSDAPQDSQWARLRESQHRAVQADADAALAVAVDLGEAVDIHPVLKKEVAERCALCFDRLVFGRKVLLSPEVVAAKLTSQGVELTFDQPLRDGTVAGFEVAGADGRFVSVGARAEGSTVVLSAPADVRTVRYAWKDNPVEANAVSSQTGLPAVPFERSL